MNMKKQNIGIWLTLCYCGMVCGTWYFGSWGPPFSQIW